MSQENEKNHEDVREEEDVKEVDDSQEDDSSDEGEEGVDYWKNRAINAEKVIVEKKKEDKKTETPKEPTSQKEGLSQKDVIALAKADIHEDDVDEVIEYAQFKGIGVKEALKSDVIETMLKNRSEFRKTAEATHTGNTKKGADKVSDQDILEKASKGDVPEPGSAEAERLFKLRRGIKE